MCDVYRHLGGRRVAPFIPGRAARDVEVGVFGHQCGLAAATAKALPLRTPGVVALSECFAIGSSACRARLGKLRSMKFTCGYVDNRKTYSVCRVWRVVCVVCSPWPIVVAGPVCFRVWNVTKWCGHGGRARSRIPCMDAFGVTSCPYPCHHTTLARTEVSHTWS